MVLNSDILYFSCYTIPMTRRWEYAVNIGKLEALENIGHRRGYRLYSYTIKEIIGSAGHFLGANPPTQKLSAIPCCKHSIKQIE